MTLQGVSKVMEYEDPELTSSSRHTKITTIYRAASNENNLKTSRKDFSQPKIQGKNQNKIGRRGQRHNVVKTRTFR